MEGDGTEMAVARRNNDEVSGGRKYAGGEAGFDLG